jgi:omega-6 fatty acid desaturase (delta-12 desaturase)
VWNDLDRRRSGVDIYSACLTVAEFQALTASRRRWYRWTRHPVVSNVLLPPLIFVVLYRLPFDAPRAWKSERRAVHATNLRLAALIGALGQLVGFERAMLVQLPIVIVASIVGVWLFTLQHLFERSLWAGHGEWTFVTAALAGSSYLRLPPILRWFTGNIGFHHVHHLNPRVPNYRLGECHDAIAGLSNVPILTLRTALRAPLFALWDEDRHTMVTFRAASRVA